VLIPAVERILLAAMAGTLWGAGFMAAPVMFRELDETAQAAALAGELTGTAAWVVLVCVAVLVPLQLRHRIRPIAAHWRLWLLILLAGLVAAGELWVRPPMEVLADQAGDVAYLSALRAAESLYIVASAVALVLVAGGPLRHEPVSAVAESSEAGR